MTATAATQEELLLHSKSTPRLAERVSNRTPPEETKDCIEVAGNCTPMASRKRAPVHWSPRSSDQTADNIIVNPQSLGASQTFVAPRPPTVSRALAAPQPFAVQQLDAASQRDADSPFYDLTALPQPAHFPVGTQPSSRPPYDLSPNALASNQNRSGRRQNSKQNKQDASKAPKVARVSKKSTPQLKPTRKHARNGINNKDSTEQRFLTTNLANQQIPPFDPQSITRRPAAISPSQMLDPDMYLSYQIDMSRHLAYNGVPGPYLIGHFLCDLHLPSTQFVKLAIREVDPQGEAYWRHLITGARLEPGDESTMAGKPVALSNGSFQWLEDERGRMIKPKWRFIPPPKSEKVEVPQTPQILKTRDRGQQQQVDQVYPGLRPGCNPRLSS
ncbi:hypothetical protein NW766_005131 [Fusarium irregulare]|uniref:Uncharacterized protein n=1 Tax=Fusarium irregulare TaxID=2494466 RepID=A0A9W8PQ37_9HYPO|nr:hypothetical protein NW766_005131 [Fusarium irregulare]